MAPRAPRTRGYRHPRALVDPGARVGAGTRVWAFAHVLPGSIIGRNCNVGDHCYVERGAVIGDEVTLKNGVAVWDRVTIHDRVFVGPNAVFTNDRYPRSRESWTSSPTIVEKGATIGANATILCGIRIGRYALVACGAVVTRDVAPYTLVGGVPARRIGWVCRCGKPLGKAERRCGKCGSPRRKATPS